MIINMKKEKTNLSEELEAEKEQQLKHEIKAKENR